MECRRGLHFCKGMLVIRIPAHAPACKKVAGLVDRIKKIGIVNLFQKIYIYVVMICECERVSADVMRDILRDFYCLTLSCVMREQVST